MTEVNIAVPAQYTVTRPWLGFAGCDQITVNHLTAQAGVGHWHRHSALQPRATDTQTGLERRQEEIKEGVHVDVKLK